MGDDEGKRSGSGVEGRRHAALRAMVAIADGPVVSLAAYTTRSAFPMAGNLRIPYGVISWAELVRGSAGFNWFDLDDD